MNHTAERHDIFGTVWRRKSDKVQARLIGNDPGGGTMTFVFLRGGIVTVSLRDLRTKWEIEDAAGGAVVFDASAAA